METQKRDRHIFTKPYLLSIHVITEEINCISYEITLSTYLGASNT